MKLIEQIARLTLHHKCKIEIEGKEDGSLRVTIKREDKESSFNLGRREIINDDIGALQYAFSKVIPQLERIDDQPTQESKSILASSKYRH